MLDLEFGKIQIGSGASKSAEDRQHQLGLVANWIRRICLMKHLKEIQWRAMARTGVVQTSQGSKLGESIKWVRVTLVDLLRG